ncbi:MAG: hypothetical protein KGI54_17440 [Pseudomonadota bacterium]|nr:hypothetical protein [Pseudomonadota bacterium]
MLVADDIDDRIVTWAERGQHIKLTCKNHPQLRWSTKNIGGIGCRTIFYNLDMDRNMGPECDCPVTALIPVQPE